MRAGDHADTLTERTKSAPLAVLAPFAQQAYDLVKHDCHFTLLSLDLTTGNYWKVRAERD